MTELTTKQAIKALALDLLVRHGYRGMSFGDIASGLDTTRANIHYHFGSKQKLVEEVLTDYVAGTLAGLAGIWAAADRSFDDKLETMLAFSRQRYRHHNPAPLEGRPWSLISRLRQDAELLTDSGREALGRFGLELRELLADALRAAQQRREFGPDLPVEEVALQIASIADSAASITQATGSFAGLERIYRSFAAIVRQAFMHPEA